MRKIKFRGRDFAGLWHIGDLIHNDDDLLIRNGCLSTFIENETAGQFTGLYDKNGNEIYEGDIIASEGYRQARHYVRYLEDEAMFIAMIIGSPLQEWCMVRQSWIDKFGKRIIGNIHDNPELLKGGAE